jgi:hypothetical protein
MRFLKRAVVCAAVVLIVLLGLLAYTFTGKRLDLRSYPTASNFSGNSTPNSATLPEVTLSLIECGKMMSKQVFIFRGGSWSEN